MKAKKSYGQHFLKDKKLACRIVDALPLLPECPRILEVGPGKGVLTRFLLQRPESLRAVEADRDMVAWLQEHLPETAGKIIAADFLKLDLETVFEGQCFSIIGNFPYNISSQILFKMLEYRHLVPQLTGMFQREVGERVVAAPGNKTYGVLSVLVQVYYEGRYLFTVKPGAFSPPPKVQSGVIYLSRRQHPIVPDELWPAFRQMVKAAFGQRRKILRNALKNFAERPEQLRHPLLQKRAEQLSVEDFLHLTTFFSGA